MCILPPSLPLAGSDPLGASFGCFWEGREMWWGHQPAQLGFLAGEPFKKTNKCLQRKLPLERYLTKWAVSFHV